MGLKYIETKSQHCVFQVVLKCVGTTNKQTKPGTESIMVNEAFNLLKHSGNFTYDQV
jgi:hypothetical protein